MGRGGSNSKQDFIKGRTNKVTLPAKPRSLGFSPVQATASGAGSHGGSVCTKNRRARQQERQQLRQEHA